MKRLLSVVCFLTVVLSARAVFALDMEYYTYGGFSEIVGAFAKLALIFSDNGFRVAFGIAMVGGIMFGGIALVMKAVGGRISPLSWGVPLMGGYLIYMATIVPQGTLWIYDPVANRNQAVGNVPDGIVFIAGTMNKIERYMVDAIYNAADPMAYQTLAGGRAFNLMYDIASTGGIVVDIDADIAASLKRYTDDCVIFELQRPGTTLTANSLASSTDFMPEFAKAASMAVFTVEYPANTTATCNAAWADLTNQLNGPNTFTDAIKTACANAGYNTSNAAEMIMCTDTLAGVVNDLAGGTAYATTDIFRQMLIGQTLNDVLLSNSPSLAMTVLAGRNTGASLIGAGIAANQWLPVFKAVITAVAITLIPFLVMFLPTPLARKALYLICGLFVYITAWGVIDAICHSMATDYAVNTLSGIITDKQLGMVSLNFFSTGPAKVLAVMGGIRWAGMALAAAVSAALVGVGGSFMGSMAGQLTGPAQHAGSFAGMTVGTPEGLAKQLNATELAPPTIANSAKFRYSDRVSGDMAEKFGQTRGRTRAVGSFGDVDGAAQAYEDTNMGKIIRFSGAGVYSRTHGSDAWAASASQFSAGAQLEESAGMQGLFNNDSKALAGTKVAPQEVFTQIAANNRLNPAEQAAAFARLDMGGKDAFIEKFATMSNTDYMTAAYTLAGVMGGGLAYEAASNMGKARTLDKVGIGGVRDATEIPLTRHAYSAAALSKIADDLGVPVDTLQADLAVVDAKQDAFGKLTVGDMARRLGKGDDDKGYKMMAGHTLANMGADFAVYGNSVGSVEKAMKMMKDRSYHDTLGVAQAANGLHMSMGDLVQRSSAYQATQDFTNRTAVARLAKELGHGNTNEGYQQLAQRALADTRADFLTYADVPTMVEALGLMKNLSWGDAKGVSQAAVEAGMNPKEFAQLTSNLRGQDVIGVAQGLKEGHFTKDDLRDAAFMNKLGQVFNEASVMAKGEAGDATIPQSLFNADGTMNEKMRLSWVDANARALEKMATLRGIGLTSLDVGANVGGSSSGASAGLKGSLRDEKQTSFDYFRARLLGISDHASARGVKDGSSYLAYETQNLYKDVRGELDFSWRVHQPIRQKLHDEIEMLREGIGETKGGSRHVPFVYERVRNGR